MIISTDKTGTLIQIHNFKYLQKLWQTLRIEIIQDHDDEGYIKRIADMDALMQNPENVIKYLSLPSQFGLYLNSYRNLNVAESIHYTNVVFGEEYSNMHVQEKINAEVTQTETQQRVTFQLTGSTVDEHTSYTGNCIYLDDQLDVCSKEIKTKFFTLNYSAKWIGLKKSFLQ